ncbi:hypothetical protein ABZ252_08835 [Streptomyces sp. NPDC006175]|uniref:hypothetical protein n=1 Tax=Streptomyces sp. NPDC006175 TaxID=3154471 RepID=UPI0033AC6DAA
MTHETMLAWLDMANSGAIQGASDRLLSAAKEIRTVANELKGRPQTVEWKGEGADAFRTWSDDPDASAVAQKSAETLLAAKEASRQEAAAEMRKLAQSYALSASQLDGLESGRRATPPVID